MRAMSNYAFVLSPELIRALVVGILSWLLQYLSAHDPNAISDPGLYLRALGIAFIPFAITLALSLFNGNGVLHDEPTGGGL